MGALSSCTRKFSKVIGAADLERVKVSRDEYVADGMSPADAALAAVADVERDYVESRAKIVEQVEKAAGAVAQPEPTAKDPDQAKPLESRGKSDQPKSTEAAVRAAIVSEFGAKAFERFNVSIGKHEDPEVRGLTHPDGRIELFPENIPAGEEVGVFLHEGVHGVVWSKLEADGVLGETVADLQRLRKTNKAVKQAYEQVPDATRAANVDEEALAYLIQNKPRMTVVQRFMNAVKRALRSVGFTAKWLDDNTNEIRQTVLDTIQRRASGKPAVQRSDIPESGLASKGQIKAIRKSAAKTLKRFWREQMSTKGGLPEEVFSRKMQRDNTIGADELHTAHMMTDFDRAVKKAYGANLSTKQVEQINNHLAGQDVDIPVSVKAAMKPMRAYLDNLSQKMISEGVVDPDSKAVETIEGNLGKYLTRSYRAFDEKNWPDQVSDAVKQRAFDYLKGELTKEQQAAPDVDELVWGKVNNILQEGTAADHMGALLSQGKLGAKDLSMLIKRKQIAPEIRALLGEYTDARVNFVRSATKMAYALANHQFLGKIKSEGQGQFFFDEPRGEFSVRIAADSSSTMEPLNGLYTTPDIKRAFELALEKEHLSSLARTVIGANGLVKYGKVVLAPTTQARNFISAFFFSVANGHIATPKRLGVAAKTISGELKGKASQRAYMLKLKRLGVVHDNPRAGELMSVLKDFSESGGRMEAILGGKARKGFDFLTRLYQAEDDFWKIVGFEAEKAMLMKHKGLGAAEAEPLAAQRIRDTYPTYSLVSRGVKWLRRFPLMGTFVSFPAEILRTSGNIIKYLKADLADPDLRPLAMQRAAGLLVASGWSYALSQVTMAMLGLGDDDDEVVKELGPPWQRNSQLAYSGYDKDGNLQYQDLTYIDPYAYLKRPISALLKDEDADDILLDAMKEMAEPFLGPDIAASSIGEVVFNSRMDGGQVYNPADTVEDQAEQIANHLRKSLQPGVASNAERIMKALQGKTSRSGKKYNLDDEVKALVGFRSTTVDVKTSLVYRTYEFNDKMRDASRILSFPLGDQNDVSDKDIRAAFTRMVHARKQAWDEMAELVHAAKSMGLDDTKIFRIINAAGVSKANANALVRRKFNPWVPSSQFLKSAQNRATETASKTKQQAVRKEFVRRRRLINQLTKEHLQEIRQEERE